jgi:CutA1 divalent ion tolerance protein
MAPGRGEPPPEHPAFRGLEPMVFGAGDTRPEAGLRRSAVQEDEVLLVMVSCPDGETATRLATRLVGEGLAACANPLPEVTAT